MPVGIAFGLYVHNIKPKRVQTYQTVQSLVTGAPDVLSRRFEPAIAHALEETEHKVFKKLWRLLHHSREQIRSYG